MEREEISHWLEDHQKYLAVLQDAFPFERLLHPVPVGEWRAETETSRPDMAVTAARRGKEMMRITNNGTPQLKVDVQ